MTLYEYMNTNMEDCDTYDSEYDACVTVCYIDEVTDGYDAFCNKLIEKVSVVGMNYGDNPIVNWNDLIRRNMPVFKSFTEEHWKKKYRNDDDEFIYQWINEIHMFLAGYVSEDFYTILIDLVDSLEEV